MSFNPGEEVICIDNSPGYIDGTHCPFSIGKSYVVLAQHRYVPNGIRVNSSPHYWDEKRFRKPLIDKSNIETGIAINVS